MCRLKLIFVLFFFMLSFDGSAQFNFNVIKTDETCVGNGTMTFNLSNINQNAEYTFIIYKQPNLTIPYDTTSNTFIEFLSAGEYVIEAIETLNGVHTAITQSVTIVNLVIPLQYYVVEYPTACNGVTIEIITIAGTPVSYEIFSGPNTYPIQESNIFEGLITNQTYQIRIYDDCGEGYVRTHTIEENINSLLLIGGNPELISCDTIRVTYSVYSSQEESDVDINFSIGFSDGTIQTFLETITAPQGYSEFYHDYPYYTGEVININLSYTNFCNENMIYSSEVILNPDVIFQEGKNECGNVYFSLLFQDMLPPYTVNFISFDGEEDFDPLDYNQHHPTHYDFSVVYGMQDNPLPLGTYTIEVSDSCGTSETFVFNSSIGPEDPTLGYGNNGCGQFTGYLLIKFETDRTVIQAAITSGPDNLNLPLDVTSYINEDGELRIYDFPEGDYIVHIIDSCGFEYDIEISIPEANFYSFLSTSYIACEDLHGTLRISSVNGGNITDAIIIDAPNNFPYALPYDATPYINGTGAVFFDSFPMGDYLIDVTDSCGFNEIKNYNIKGDIYNVAPYIEVIKQCNIFDIFLQMNPLIRPQLTPNNQESYWLQYFDEDTGEWKHPFTGGVYPAGTVPTDENAILLLNLAGNASFLNTSLFGDFRIVKVFTIITSDSPYQTQTCIKENYYTFNYNQDLTILDAYKILCEDNNGNQSVVILAEGIPPLTYYITTKNGEPYNIDNGENSIFTGLEPALYNFQVRDNCGNIRNREFHLNNLQSITASEPIPSMIYCSDEQLSGYEFYLPDKNIHLIASTLPLEYFSFSYHLSYSQAYNNLNSLPDYYTLNQEQEVRIYVRIENILLPDCFSIVYFDLVVIQTPNISDIPTQYSLCTHQESVTLLVIDNFDSYLWSDGSTSHQLQVYQPGTYSVIVSNFYENVICEKEIVFTVSASDIPEIEKIHYIDWTYTNNSITINTTLSGQYLYSLNGINYQESNVFENLHPGYYTIYIKNECGEITAEALLLNYPRYFTPNGDGFNEFWRIEFGNHEPEMRISIFDRYGKLIKVFMGHEQGWDGTYNGSKLLASDYWFTVERKNGIIRRGHFSLLR